VASRKPGEKVLAAGPARPTVTELVELAVKHDLAELEVEQGGARIRVVRERGAVVGAPAPRVEGGAPTAPQVVPVAEPALAAHLVKVEAPMVGTFYRASAPEASPYVQEGDVVKDGQVLCIIEAMKLMNEIEAKVAGRIARILVDNGQPVEFAQPLFLIDPKA
jgi:acetyl-CoA carboxylase biotin carboxyl carrier protein